ncbi:MAG: O-antigen ligase family protein [Phycisphaerales bacterium]
MAQLLIQIGSCFKGFLTGSYISRDQCDRAFERMHTRDGIGDQIHLVFACIAMVGIAGPVSVVDIAVLPMVVFFLIRVINTFPVWIHGFGQPVVLVAMALAGLMGLSLMWSSDPVAGLENMSELRWLAMIGFVYPVIEHRRLLLACLCAGFVLGHGAQVIDAFNGFGNAWLYNALWHEPNRVSGWWDPAVGGSLLVGVLGLHLPSALIGRGRWRVLGVMGSLITMTALLATGTRGAWIASAGLIVLALLCAGTRYIRVSERSTKRLLWTAGFVCAATVGGVVVILSVPKVGGVFEPANSRVQETRVEIARAMDGDLGSFTGARISMGTQAVRAGAEHPILGLGAGGFRDWMQAQTPEVLDDHAHAHSSGLQLWSEHGLPGVLLGVVLVLVLIVSAWRTARAGGHPYDYATLGAITGLLMVSAFDSILMNVNTAAMLGALAALSPSYAPGLHQMGTQKSAHGSAGPTISND